MQKMYQTSGHGPLAGEALATACGIGVLAELVVDHSLPQRAFGGVVPDGLGRTDASCHAIGLEPQPLKNWLLTHG